MVSYSDIVVISILVIFTFIGCFKGMILKLLHPIVWCASFGLSYYIASPISSLFIGTNMYNSMVGAMGDKGAGVVLLIVTGIITFVIIFICLKLLAKLISSTVEAVGPIKVLNRILGGLLGLATGLLFSAIYLLIFFGLSEGIQSINAFFLRDMGISPEHFTFSKYLLDGTIKLFKKF